MELSKNNIDFIKSEVQKEGIKFSHLQDDLIDHICTQIEKEMESGLNFNDAYKKVKSELKFSSLKNIEVDTLISLNKYLLKIRRRANIIGTTALVIILVGIILKMQHVPFGNYLFLAGMIALIIGYIPMLFVYSAKRNSSNINKATSISGFIAAIVTSISFIFVNMAWNFKSYLLLLSYFSILCFLIFYFLYTIRLKESKVTNLSILFFLFIFIIFQFSGFYYNLTNRQKDLYAVEENINESISYYREQNLKMIEVLVHRDSSITCIKPLNTKTQELLNLINKTISIFNNSKSGKLNNPLIKDDLPYYAEDYHKKIEQAVLDYKSYLLDANKELKDINLEKHIEQSIQWNNLYFFNPANITYNNLKNLQYQILEIQNEILTKLSLMH